MNKSVEAPPMPSTVSDDSSAMEQAAGQFRDRHLGSSAVVAKQMAAEIGFASVDELIAAAVPAHIRRRQPFQLPDAVSEADALTRLRSMMQQNRICRSLIGMGYHDCVTPPVLQRNIIENPGWYTAYTPYQPEISQGRLEACLNFQTMICDLSGLAVSNASLLDEGTAAAEAMTMCFAGHRTATRFFVADACHPQTIAVLQTRAAPVGIEVVVGSHADITFDDTYFGALIQYPDTNGAICDFRTFIDAAHDAKVAVVMAADLLSLTLLTPPGELGADIAVGSSQRFGVPMGFGGPHAGWISCSEKFMRKLPGRLVGISKDAHGNPAYRLSLQTREQHIRRDKATSNICTAQVLLAVVASMYAAWHGPKGLRRIAERVHGFTAELAARLTEAGYAMHSDTFFDTLRISIGDVAKSDAILRQAANADINLRRFENGDIGIALDERTSANEIAALCDVFNAPYDGTPIPSQHLNSTGPESRRTEMRHVSQGLRRTSEFLAHPVFNSFHTETEMMRYLHRLESKDLALNTSMIPLGSCTMKLNAAAEMMPLSWPEVGSLHPFAPPEQWAGYSAMIEQLESWLAACTGFHAVSVQPNAGSQGELAGLLAIRGFHLSNGGQNRNICLIPTSAHGTNPASAVMAGMKVVAVSCDDEGNIDVDDLKSKAAQHSENLAALMVTYPSTHGVFEDGIRDICDIIHHHGGQVYMDGANLNAQLGLVSPAELGADVCHLNLHKTFCIPHGGGGPGVGPIGVAQHLANFLPGHPIHSPSSRKGEQREVGSLSPHAVGPVSAAPYGSASILTISWMYIAMMGADGLTESTRQAILNANYIAHRLQPYFPVLYRGANSLVAHECILDLRPFKADSGVEVEDVAKRLMDYGFHSPTMSWPVPGTLMVEPTESESKAELDRFCDAMISIYKEIMDVKSGTLDREDNPLKHAPHTAAAVTSDDWNRSYSRQLAAYPASWLKDFKYWPPVGRVDNVYGDRHLVCTCQGVSSYAE
ncbi:MAG: aminomethyl-transferring glycine dehydrogenase [Planctomycetaceae bacterium]